MRLIQVTACDGLLKVYALILVHTVMIYRNRYVTKEYLGAFSSIWFHCSASLIKGNNETIGGIFISLGIVIAFIFSHLFHVDKLT